jgi:PTH1 family peptidyl-tRNA hydrolase
VLGKQGTKHPLHIFIHEPENSTIVFRHSTKQITGMELRLSALSNFFKNLFHTKQEEFPDPMKYLIAGLGNIGAKYDNTRHNVGFEIVNYLANEFDAEWSAEQLGDIASFRHKGRTFILLKPSTYMNRSGKAVRYWLQKEKIEKSNLLVVMDDLNLDFGKIRLRSKGSDGGHNGLKDIDQMTGGNNYARLRIGIGSNYSKGKQVDYVLGEWSSEEQRELSDIIKKAAEAIKAFGTIGIQHAMSQHNR